MYIHNLYNDIMLSTSILLDHKIFERENFIKRYEFNLGNRTFQLGRDPKVNVDFPVALITINDENASFGHRTETIKQFTSPNINTIPVLYNKSNRQTLYLNEEQTNIPITIAINTESQLQAKEISHIVRRILPLNKLIQQISFTSFLEIPLDFLSKVCYDPYNHDIINIFSKFDKLIGNTNFYYSVKYEPFIRLDSISAAVPDSSQRTYQVNIDLTYIMQWPMYVYSEKYNIIERINIHLGTEQINPVTYFDTIRLFNDDKQVKNYLLYELDDSINHDDNNSYITFQFDKNYVDISNKNSQYSLISLKYNKFMNNIIPFSFVEDDNKITFKIDKQDYYKYYTPSIKNPIVLQILI